jgi:hypothetical protein
MGMWTSVYARFTLKNRPKGRLGLNFEDWTFARKKPLSFDVLIGCIAAKLAEFYLNTGLITDLDEMNRLVQKAGEQVQTICFRPVPEDVDDEID